jgi:uridine kinase
LCNGILTYVTNSFGSGLDELPYEEQVIKTPLDCTYKGLVQTPKICGISVVRAGATMEKGLRSVLKDIPIGKILIQTDQNTGAPQLHYCKLPKDISDRYVLIMDSHIGTGAGALMAIRVILDHDVPQEKIIFCSLITTPLGIYTIHQAFPKVKVVSSEVDKEINDAFKIVPGFGNYGDRYFGTD